MPLIPAAVASNPAIWSRVVLITVLAATGTALAIAGQLAGETVWTTIMTLVAGAGLDRMLPGGRR